MEMVNALKMLICISIFAHKIQYQTRILYAFQTIAFKMDLFVPTMVSVLTRIVCAPKDFMVSSVISHNYNVMLKIVWIMGFVF